MYLMIYTNVHWIKLNAECQKTHDIQFVLRFQAKNQDRRILARRISVLQGVNVCQVDSDNQ